MKKRIFSIVLLTALLFGGAWGALTLRGLYYVRLEGGMDWRMLAFVVPAERYEMTTVTNIAPPYDGTDTPQQWNRLCLSCMDGAGRELRSIAMTTGDINDQGLLYLGYEDHRYQGPETVSWYHSTLLQPST